MCVYMYVYTYAYMWREIIYYENLLSLYLCVYLRIFLKNINPGRELWAI